MNFTKKLLYVMILTLFIISIVYSYNVSDVEAEVNRTQELTIQSNLDVIEFQPPVDINTSQRIELPGNLIGILNFQMRNGLNLIVNSIQLDI